MTTSVSEPRPEWMIDSFLKKCIIKSKNISEDSDIKIGDVFLSYVVPKGENYLSVLYRVNVKYEIKANTIENGEESYVVKVAHEVGHFAKFSDPAFDNEVIMYREVVPAIQKELEEKNLDTTLICRCIHTILDGNPKVIVFDDLKVLGYIVQDRKKGIDFDHCKLVLSKLAKLHAGSKLYYSNLDDKEKKKFNNHPFIDNEDDSESTKQQMKAFVESLTKGTTDIIDKLITYGDTYEKSVDFLKTYRDKVDDVIFYLPPRKPNSKFNAIIHSDCWINNMMFKYGTDGSVKDVLLIDLQISHFSTVAQDFLYFFFSSVNMDVRKNRFDDVKKYYLDCLVSALKGLGLEDQTPTMEEFDEELRRCVLSATSVLTTLLTLVLKTFDNKSQARDDSKAFSMEEIMNMIDDTKDTLYYDVVVASVEVLQSRGFFNNFPELIKKERAVGM